MSSDVKWKFHFVNISLLSFSPIPGVTQLSLIRVPLHTCQVSRLASSQKWVGHRILDLMMILGWWRRRWNQTWWTCIPVFEEMLVSLAELEGAWRGISGKVGGSSLGLGSPLGDPFELSLVVFKSLFQNNKRSHDICTIWTDCCSLTLQGTYKARIAHACLRRPLMQEGSTGLWQAKLNGYRSAPCDGTPGDGTGSRAGTPGYGTPSDRTSGDGSPGYGTPAGGGGLPCLDLSRWSSRTLAGGIGRRVGWTFRERSCPSCNLTGEICGILQWLLTIT